MPGEDYHDEPRRTNHTTADRAANWAIGWAVASIVCAGAGVWLAVGLNLGWPPLVLGLIGWVIAWAVGMGFAIGALRGAYSSTNPGEVRKKSWGAIGLSAFSLVLVITYSFALLIAAQRIEG